MDIKEGKKPHYKRMQSFGRRVSTSISPGTLLGSEDKVGIWKGHYLLKHSSDLHPKLSTVLLLLFTWICVR